MIPTIYTYKYYVGIRLIKNTKDNVYAQINLH